MRQGTEWNWAPVNTPDHGTLNFTGLHPWEAERLKSFRAAKRRSTFTAGRLAAKKILSPYFSAPPKDIAILSWDRHGHGCRPTVWVGGKRHWGKLSIAHDEHQAVATWAADSKLETTVDIVAADSVIYPSPVLFTESERHELRQRVEMAVRWFSAKEAAYKASNDHKFYPTRFQVVSASNDQSADFQVRFLETHLACRCVLAFAIANPERHCVSNSLSHTINII